MNETIVKLIHTINNCNCPPQNLVLCPMFLNIFSPSDSPRKVWVRWTLGLPEQLKSTNWVLCTELHGQHSLTDVRKRRQINARCKAQTNMNMATRKPEKIFHNCIQKYLKNCSRNTEKTRKHLFPSSNLYIKLTYIVSKRGTKLMPVAKHKPRSIWLQENQKNIS